MQKFSSSTRFATTHGAQLTLKTIRRWAAAMDAATFDVRLIPADPEAGQRPILRSFTPVQLEAAVPWLRWQNRIDYHSYARPLDTAVVLVDDLCPDGLNELRRHHCPCAVVETSPSSFQAWLRLSLERIAADLAGAAARLLARRHDGDGGAANAHQIGRLPGLCNRKPIHQRADGSYPFTRLLIARPGVDPGGAALLHDAGRLLERERRAACGTGPAAFPPALRLRPAMPEQEYEAALAKLLQAIPAGALDRSRLDFAIARRLLVRGAGQAFAEQVVLAGPRSRSMSQTAAESYARRTVAAAARNLGLTTPDSQ